MKKKIETHEEAWNIRVNLLGFRIKEIASDLIDLGDELNNLEKELGNIKEQGLSYFNKKEKCPRCTPDVKDFKIDCSMYKEARLR